MGSPSKLGSMKGVKWAKLTVGERMSGLRELDMWQTDSSVG